MPVIRTKGGKFRIPNITTHGIIVTIRAVPH